MFVKAEIAKLQSSATRKNQMIIIITGMLLSVILASFSGRCESAEGQSPGEVIKTFNDTLLEAMKKTDQLGYSGRYKLLDPVIKDSFALSFMAVQSLGRYGKNLKPEEKDLLIKIYTDWTIATYAARFDSYSGERFGVVSESGSKQGTVTVISKLIKSNGDEVVFHYLMRKVEGSWRIVDIQIRGVSQLALTRAQFVGVLRDKGLSGLISMLKEKIRGFEKAGGKKE